MKMKNKKITISIFTIVLLLGFALLLFMNKKTTEKIETENIRGTLLTVTKNSITIQDDNNGIYTFQLENPKAQVGDHIVLEYTGILEKETTKQKVTITNYTAATPKNSLDLPSEWKEDGLFKDFYDKAYKKLNTLSLDEKISQLILARYDEAKALTDVQKYTLGGFVFFEKDFKNKTTQEIKSMINKVQNASKIPLLTAVDEEGGKVIRISSNPNVIDEPFKSSQELYKNGGFESIKDDTIKKSNLLKELGLNVNLAPVIDVVNKSTSYMYPRSFGQNTELTSKYAKTVIEASKNLGVSYTLKHFPGYGDNADTHTSTATDTRTYEDLLKNDLPPFEAGINSGAEAVLVSHNIVTSIDSVNPSSLSPSVHNVLRNRLNFSGIIITDDLAMGATSSLNDTAIRALLAGNDLIITTNYEQDIEKIKNALTKGTISEELINRVSLRVLAWKYYKGLIIENEK